MAKETRGFASMDRTKRREVASKGGKAAHLKGTAHEWSNQEAREAGRKGGGAATGSVKTLDSRYRRRITALSRRTPTCDRVGTGRLISD
jgi:general stress protein YciG